MADNSMAVNSATDAYGNQYTQSISNDELTTNDFLKLMIEELKLQDPTKPMDSSKMLSTQMQMSTLNANMEMIKALQSIQTAFNQSSLSTAAGVIGNRVENGATYEDGTAKKFQVTSIEMKDGEVIVVGREYKYSIYEIALKEGEGDDAKYTAILYDADGNIYDEKGEKTGKTIVLESIGKPKLEDGKMIIKDEDGKEIKDHNYLFTGTVYPQYSEEDTKFPFSSITKIG
ncbi:flagellar hook assembly protein FlgD [Arcobacter sp. CECT 9188]|uniref:flagellar hook assembly protein FlgD n=1 Tax=Arcobacter sp. CECT 9188 TaxID=2044505 RepID=UPI000DE9776F|nr:flagellar hook capping FlgD N-terminal domain-containing protein [Arcobacter sp. CECT 9188]RBQ25972.1 flagellar biosynthesis protein FlgD [Arcobacter sp. CECT 9188]